MAKSKKRKSLPPRVKRMNRSARLDSAKKWIPTYTGKHLLHGYCNHYAVDWRCAVIELKLLGITIDPAYIAQRERTEAEIQRQRQAKTEERESLQKPTLASVHRRLFRILGRRFCRITRLANARKVWRRMGAARNQ
jgi:hypothetical protein